MKKINFRDNILDLNLYKTLGGKPNVLLEYYNIIKKQVDVCVICNTEVTIRRSGYTVYIPDVCGPACRSKLAAINTDYTARQVLLDEAAKKIDLDSGLTISQLRSYKAAETRKTWKTERQEEYIASISRGVKNSDRTKWDESIRIRNEHKQQLVSNREKLRQRVYEYHKDNWKLYYRLGTHGMNMSKIKIKNVFNSLKVCYNKQLLDIFTLKTLVTHVDLCIKCKNKYVNIDKATFCSRKCSNQVTANSIDRDTHLLSKNAKLQWENKTDDEKEKTLQYLMKGRLQYIKLNYDEMYNKISKTKIDRLQSIPKHLQSEYKIYYNECIRITNNTDVTILPKYELRGKYNHDYHLDHIFPIMKGFLYKIPANMIGCISNLEFITGKENRTKSSKITKIPAHIEEYLDENNKNWNGKSI